MGEGGREEEEEELGSNGNDFQLVCFSPALQVGSGRVVDMSVQTLACAEWYPAVHIVRHTLTLTRALVNIFAPSHTCRKPR